MPKVALDSIEQTNRTGYPPPFDQPVAGRHYRKLGEALGLADFGVTEATLEPGAWSSQRHWHEAEDELVVMIEGEAVLVEDEAETLLRPGDLAIFRKGVSNGHHLINRSVAPCRFIAVGKVAASDCHYPDIDMHLDGARGSFVRKDGSSF
ncbi:MAG: cupin domain-containing protein [Pseudomonadota bacterium]|nr:cupin domain-containing protein [Pseudomonadota bacterium]